MEKQIVTVQEAAILHATLPAGRVAYSLGPDTFIVHWYQGSRASLPAVLELATKHRRARVLWVVERKSFIPVLIDTAAMLADWQSPTVQATVFEIRRREES